MVFTAKLALAIALAAAAGAAPGGQARSGEPGGWVKLLEMPKGLIGARGFCKPVLLPDDRLLLWGPPGKDVARDWAAAVIELSSNRWLPLPPKGREDWLRHRPKLPPADPEAGRKLLAAIKPNRWVPLKPPRSAHARTWGSIALDTDRHEVILWGGGNSGG